MHQHEENHERDYNDIGLTGEMALPIFDSLTVGVLLIRRAQGVILANTKAATYLGTDRDRLMEEGLKRDDASSGEKYLDKIIENVIRSGHPFSQDDIALRVTDDLVSYYSIKVKPLATSRELALVILDDVSEQVEIEKHLGEVEARIARVVTYLPDPIFIIEEGGTFSFFSYRDNIAFGYELPTFTGEQLTGLFADGVSAGEEFLAELKERKEIEGYETRILDSDGEVVNVSISAMNIADPEIGSDAYIGTIRDITESVIRTDELTALKDFSENILDNIEVGVIVVDMDFNIIRWSYGQEIESGIAEADVLGRDLLELLPNLKEEKAGRRTIEEHGREVMRTGQPFRVERFVHRDHKEQYGILDLRLSPFRDNEGKTVGLVIINDNITEKVNLEREVDEKTIRLKVERNRLVDLFEFTNKLRELDDIGEKIDLTIDLLNDLGWEGVYCKLYENDTIHAEFGSTGLNDTEIEILESVFNRDQTIPKWAGVKAISGNCYLISKEAPSGFDGGGKSDPTNIYASGIFDHWEQDILFILLRNSKNEILGVIVLRRSADYQGIKKEVLSVLDLLATSLSLIIDEFQARMLVEKRNRGLRAITRISRNLNSVLSVEGPFNEVLVELEDLIGFDIAAICYKTNGQYECITFEGTDTEFPAQLPIETAKEIFDEVIRDREPVLLTDMASDPRFSVIGTGSAICIPIIFQGEGCGCIYLNCREVGFFSNYDMELITLIADHAATALQNIKYFEEEKLRVKQLSDIYKAGQLAASILDVDELYRSVVAALYSPDRYQFVSIACLDAEKREVKIHTYRGPGDNDTKRVSYSQSIGIGAVGEAAKTGKIVYIRDTEADNRYERVGFISGMYSEIAVPIIVEGQVCAVLNVENLERNAFSETDIASLGSLSAQIAVAIRNATLMTKLREKSDELTRANLEMTRFGELREEFVSMLVHDMRTPLTGIIGSAEIIDEFIADEANDQIKQLMGIISNEARRMADLINDIRDFYRLLPDEIGLNPEPVAINDLLDEVYNLNRKNLAGAGVTVEIMEDTNLPVTICDRSKLFLALSNVLKSVISNCEIEESVTLSAELTEDKSIRISYRYECAGNTCGEVKQFFEEKRDAILSFSKLSKSSHLGLSIAETIINAHRGNMGMTCSGGEKSELYVEVPLIES